MIFQEDLSLVGTILDSLSEGVVVADSDGRLQYFNPVAEEILGIGVQDVDPGEWTATYGCFHPDGCTPYPSEELPLARALRGEEVRDVLLHIRNPMRPEGVLINLTGRPIRDESGNLTGGTVTFRDVTQNIRSEYEISRLSKAVEQTADSVVITDVNGLIEYVNPAFEITTGYSSDEVMGKKPGILKSGHHDQEFYQELWSTLRRAEPYRGSVLNKKKNGELYWSQQTITPMKNLEGEVTDFVSVARDITDFIERQKIEARLQVAREIQQRLYHESISVPGFDIAGASYPAEETNGDYYDFIRAPDGRVWIILGDVCSHGLGSALIMTQTRAFIHALVLTEHEPGVVLERLNQELVKDLDPYHYVTMVLIRLDPESRIMEYVNAGHPSGGILNSSGDILHELASARVPLGFLPDQDYPMSDPIQLNTGDLIALVSDGILEAENESEVQFGDKRALKIIRQHHSESAKDIVGRVYEAVQSYSAGNLPEDDVTAIICKAEDH
ncbi:SpoIIE family protein phosphatase [Gemmatimonadota bacterium]